MEQYYELDFLNDNVNKGAIITPQDLVVYKGTNQLMCCREYQFKLNTTHRHTTRDPVICGYGFHACVYISDTFDYYPWNPRYRFFKCVIPAGSKIDIGIDKIAASHIRFEAELSNSDLIALYLEQGHQNDLRMTTSIIRLIAHDTSMISRDQFCKFEINFGDSTDDDLINLLCSHAQFIDCIDLPKMWLNLEEYCVVELLTAYPHLCDTIPNNQWKNWAYTTLLSIARITALSWSHLPADVFKMAITNPDDWNNPSNYQHTYYSI